MKIQAEDVFGFGALCAVILMIVLIAFVAAANRGEPEAELIVGSGEPVCECAACIPLEGRE